MVFAVLVKPGEPFCQSFPDELTQTWGNDQCELLTLNEYEESGAELRRRSLGCNSESYITARLCAVLASDHCWNISVSDLP